MYHAAIEFLEAIDEYRENPTGGAGRDKPVTKEEVDRMAARLSHVEILDLPNGELGLVLLDVRNTARRWLDPDTSHGNVHILWDWACKITVLDLLQRLVRHYDPEKIEPPPLTENDRRLLFAMWRLGAVADEPATFSAILKEARWDGDGGHAFEALQGAGYVRTKRNVGTWLTRAGIACAKGLLERIKQKTDAASAVD